MSSLESNQINHSEESCINLVNHLISQCAVSIAHVSCIGEIDGNLIVSLYEAITGSIVPDLLACEGKVEEAHNVQAVIDTLSLDLLGISLSHITGDAVVAGDVTSIFNLLQILEGVIPYLSVEKNGQKAMKRKIRRIKKRNSQSFKENGISRSDLHECISSYNSSSTYSETIFPLHLKNKRLKPAFSSTRLSTKSSSKTSGSISNKSAKESSVLYPTHKTSTKRNGSSEKISAEKTRLHTEDICTDTVDRVSIADTPVFPKESGISSKILHSPTNAYSDQNNTIPKEQTIPLKNLVTKRKISKLHSKSRIKDMDNEQGVEKLYEENLESQLKALIEKNISFKSRSSGMKRLHLQTMRKPLKKSPLPPCRKSFLLPYTLRRRSAARTSVKPSKHPLIDKNIQKTQTAVPLKQTQSWFIRDLLDEFPSIQLSSTILNHVKEKYEQHLFKMHKRVTTSLLQKPKTQVEAENAAKRQRVISNILKKDVQEQQYLKEVKERKNHENKIKFRLRDSRLKSVQMKHYYDEFHEEMRKKMQKRNIAEELVFERAFKEAINIQKDHVERLCQQVKETGENDAKQYLTYLESLENLYQTQFLLLSETLANEKRDAHIRVNAEKEVMEKMQKDFQETLKREIRFMQRTIVEQTEDCHFRELDAELFIERMRKQY